MAKREEKQDIHKVLTERGEHLRKAHEMRQGDGREKCGCGFRVRGPNHCEGKHHKEGRKVK